MLEVNRMKTCLIGLGNVGFGRYVLNKSERVLDHYSAIKRQESLELVLCVDKVIPNEISDPRVSDVTEISFLEVDLLVVSSPTNTHLAVLKTFLDKNAAKIILIEKPCSNSLQEINDLNKLLKKYSNTELLINYQRNYNQIFIDEFKENTLGSLQTGIVHYSNGALNNASHALALILPLIGHVTSVRVLRKLNSGSLSDFDFAIESEFGERIVFLATEEKLYSNFRIELDFQNGVVSYDSSKGEIQRRASVPDPDFNNRRSLEPIGRTVGTSEQISFEHVYNFLVSKLRREATKPGLGVDLLAAMKIHEVFEEIKHS